MKVSGGEGFKSFRSFRFQEMQVLGGEGFKGYRSFKFQGEEVSGTGWRLGGNGEHKDQERDDGELTAGVGCYIIRIIII